MDGFLIIDKPCGISSFDVLRRLNKKFSLKRRGIKIGHGGTLDPLATGVLIVAIGHATRMLQFALSDEKSYRATIRIGAQTSTDDAEGDIIKTAPYDHIDMRAIERALETFRGKIMQTPPKYSAVHAGGQRAYEIARRGGNAELAAKSVEIYSIDIASYIARSGQMPELTADISCSGGTYIRSIARDLGFKLGSAASLVGLARTRACGMMLSETKRLDDILASGDISEHLMAPCEFFRRMPRIKATPDDIGKLFKGQKVRFDFPKETSTNGLYRVQTEDPGWIYAFARKTPVFEITRFAKRPD